jgi:hypothetical protein
MSDALYANVVLPLAIGIAGGLYALWAAWSYNRNMDRWEREQAEKAKRVVE